MPAKRRRTSKKSPRLSGGLLAALAAFIVLFFGSAYLAYTQGIGPLARFVNIPGVNLMIVDDTPEHFITQTMRQEQEGTVTVRNKKTGTTTVEKVYEPSTTTSGGSSTTTTTTSPTTCGSGGTTTMYPGKTYATGYGLKDDGTRCKTGDVCPQRECVTWSSNCTLSKPKSCGDAYLADPKNTVLPVGEAYGTAYTTTSTGTKILGFEPCLAVPTGNTRTTSRGEEYCFDGNWVPKKSVASAGNEACASRYNDSSYKFDSTKGICIKQVVVTAANTATTGPTQEQIAAKKDECFRQQKEYRASSTSVGSCGADLRCGQGYVEDGQYCRINATSDQMIQHIIDTAEARCTEVNLPFNQNTGLCESYSVSSGRPISCDPGTSSDGHRFYTCIRDGFGTITGKKITFCYTIKGFDSDGNCQPNTSENTPQTDSSPEKRLTSEYTKIGNLATNCDQCRGDTPRCVEKTVDSADGSKQTTYYCRPEEVVPSTPSQTPPTAGQKALQVTSSLCASLPPIIPATLASICNGIKAGETITTNVPQEQIQSTALMAAGVVTSTACLATGPLCTSVLSTGNAIIASSEQNNAQNPSSADYTEVPLQTINTIACNAFTINPVSRAACQVGANIGSTIGSNETVQDTAKTATYFVAQAPKAVIETVNENRYTVGGLAIGSVSGVRCLPLIITIPGLFLPCWQGGVIVGGLTGAAADYVHDNPEVINSLLVPKESTVLPDSKIEYVPIPAQEPSGIGTLVNGDKPSTPVAARESQCPYLAVQVSSSQYLCLDKNNQVLEEARNQGFTRNTWCTSESNQTYSIDINSGKWDLCESGCNERFGQCNK